MAHFKAQDAPIGWRPQKGDVIEGIYRKRLVRGEFERIARVRTGAVLAFVRTNENKRIGLIEIRPIGESQ